MKKVLYGTTALVAAGVMGAGSADAKISLGLGGYMNTFFSVASIDEADSTSQDYNPTGLFSDGEVHFRGEYKHDNGITFGANVQLEMFGTSNTGDTIDEKYAFVDGDFGRIVAGSENTAAYIMHYAAPNVGLPVNSGWVTVFIPVPGTINGAGLFRSPGSSTYLDYGNDDNGITYYTPRFWGFQVGLTYTPSVVGNGDGKNFPVEADTETEYNNGFAVGVNYVEDFNGFGIALSGGYRYATVDDTRNDPPGGTGADDYQAVSAGLNLSYAGFTVGGSYANEMEGKQVCATSACGGGISSSTEGFAWDVGVSYEFGPWAFGVTYLHGEQEGLLADPDQDELDTVSGGLSYALGPGITARAGVMWADWKPENGGSQSGIAGAVGLSFSF
jgi:outer membrane protein OmpU